MKRILISMVIILAVLMVPASVMASDRNAPTAFRFSAMLLPTSVTVLSDWPLGQSGLRMMTERVKGFFAPVPWVPENFWLLLNGATGEILVTTIYEVVGPNHIQGRMWGKLTIATWNPDYTPAGTLVLNYSATVFGPGEIAFKGTWVSGQGTGVFKGVHGNGSFYADSNAGIPPILEGLVFVK